MKRTRMRRSPTSTLSACKKKLKPFINLAFYIRKAILLNYVMSGMLEQARFIFINTWQLQLKHMEVFACRQQKLSNC